MVVMWFYDTKYGFHGFKGNVDSCLPGTVILIKPRFKVVHITNTLIF